MEEIMEIMKDFGTGVVAVAQVYAVVYCSEYLSRHIPEADPDEDLSHLLSKLSGFADKTKERMEEAILTVFSPLYNLIDKYYPIIKKTLEKDIFNP